MSLSTCGSASHPAPSPYRKRTAESRAARQRLCVAATSPATAAAAAAAPASCSRPDVAGEQLHHHQRHEQLQQLSRRSTLLTSLQAAFALWASRVPASAAAPAAVITVGAGRDCGSIGEALRRAPSGGIVEVYGGRYKERLLISRPVTIAAAAGEAVEVVWETAEPYQATIECGALEEPGAVAMQGLRVLHSSPSIANNYAVHLVGSCAVLRDCDISSSTGDGIGIEGGSPAVERCVVHDCARHGIAVFGDLFGGGCTASIEGCAVGSNRLSGLLVRDGATPAVTGCTLSGNGEWGLRLQDAGGRYDGNSIAANARGSVAYEMLFDEVDTAQMVVVNKLDRPVQYLGRKK